MPSAIAEQYDEYTIKAALLYNFTRFVQWPTNISRGESEYRICIVGEDPYDFRLDALEAHTQSKITIYRYQVLREAVYGCQIIFIGETSRTRLLESIAYMHSAPVLTVGDTPDFVMHGGMIGLVVVNKKIRFEINLAAANRAGLDVSSQLLRVAQKVIRE